MTTITSLGTGSGLDLEGLVTKLMAAESAPLTALQKKQSSYATKISALGSLSSSLSSLQTAANALMAGTLQTASAKFTSYTATLTNTAVASATASTGAVSGKYSLEVSQLAGGQQLTGSPYASSSTSVTTGAGILKLELGTLTTPSTYSPDAARTYNLNLAAGATLADVRDAINAANAGVTASIVNGTNGSQLVLNGKEGANNVMRLSGIAGLTYDPVAAGAQPFTQNTPAQDALFKLNGIAATSSSNTVSGALDGVTLQLTATNVGAPTSLSVTQDVATNLTQSLQAFVTAYNATYSKMAALGAYDPASKVAGDLQGNSTLTTAQSQIRRAITNTNSGSSTSPYKILNNIGVSISVTGTLSIDSSKLNAAIKADPTTVANLVSNVGSAFNTTINNLITAGGPISIATNGLNTTVKSIQAQEDKMQTRLTAIEARYRAQFSAMDSVVAKFKSTGDFLTSFISSTKSSGN